MKIARIETFLVPPRWLFCRVETDTGIVGWGEPVVEGRAEAVRAAVGILGEYLAGQDPLRVEDHWQVMTKGGFYRGGPVLSSAVAGLDQALWDIAGKHFGAPAYALFGGPVRDRVRVYAWVGGDDPGELREAIEEQVAAGFTAVKMNASGLLPRALSASDLDGVVARAAVAREVLGPSRDFAVDLHGRATVANARRIIAALAHLHPLFVEEPVAPEYLHRLGELAAATDVPLALGERLYSRADFLPALRSGLAVAQPDPSHAGGISEVRRIASLAETFDVQLAPHCPLGPIALAASLQLAFSTPNFLIQEQSAGIHYNQGADLFDHVLDPAPFTFTDGHAHRTDLPGLGVTIDEQSVRRAARNPHTWRNPVWRHADGSMAEW
jgi:galactonate dehydratase